MSSRANRVLVTNVSGPFEGTNDDIRVRLVRHNTMKAIHVVSETDIKSGKWTMFGGNFLYSSDSRFSEKARELLGDVSAHVGAIGIHDRIEG